jgi:hypothetical protein
LSSLPSCSGLLARVRRPADGTTVPLKQPPHPRGPGAFLIFALTAAIASI